MLTLYSLLVGPVVLMGTMEQLIFWEVLVVALISVDGWRNAGGRSRTTTFPTRRSRSDA